MPRLRAPARVCPKLLLVVACAISTGSLASGNLGRSGTHGLALALQSGTTTARRGTNPSVKGDIGTTADEISTAQEELRKSPASADAHLKLAEAYRRRKRYNEAINLYQKAARMRQDYFEAYFGLAESYRGLVGYPSSQSVSVKSAADAIHAYKQAIHIRPDSPEAHLGLAKTFRETNQNEEALEELQIVIELKPDSASAYMEIGEIFFWPIYGQIFSGNPVEATAERDKDLRLAIAAFRRVIEIEPKHELAYLDLARACDILGRYDEAIAGFFEVIRITPYGKWGEAYFGLCETYRKSGKLVEGIETFKERVRVIPRGSWEHYTLGILYLYSGNKGAALEQYKIMKDLKSGDLADSLFKEIYPQ